MTAKMGMWREHLVGTATGVTLTLTSEAVPSGERRYLSLVYGVQNTTANADVVCYVLSHGYRVPFWHGIDLEVNLGKSQRQAFWLTEGERLEFDFSGIVLGEVVQVGMVGHIQYKESE